MELAISTAHQRGGRIYTYGPLIHNPQVLDLLTAKGVEVIKDIPAPGSVKGGTVIIRAHGVPPEEKQRLKEAGFERVVDGTCPRVVKVQAVIQRATLNGSAVVIVGDPDHPEVVALLAHARGQGHVVSRPEEAAGLPELKRVVAVAQTTQSEDIFAETCRRLQNRFGQVEVHETICEATHSRQREVLRLAQEVDGVVVVGGKASANTKRLTQLAAAGGRPAFLVETEADLERATLTRLDAVGVTAGASTPNWMIKKVVRELTALRSAREPRLTFCSQRIFRYLVRSQLLVALGAAGMTLASTLLQSITLTWTLVGIALFYIFAMHILNHFLDKEAGQYNEPDRAQFLAKHRRSLVGFGVFAAAASLVLCAMLGGLPFALVLIMSALGVSYSLPVIPKCLERRIPIQRLKDIPGSKTLSAALAWAFIVALVPALAVLHSQLWDTLLAFLYTLVLVFVRCALFDILDVQGDLIVGKETIPIVLGEKKTRRLLTTLTHSLGVLMILAPLMGLASTLAWALLLPIAGFAAMQSVLLKNLVMPGALSEGMVDINFLLAGAVALVWWVWPG
jgi:4-hydroxy-3-methylbut-2-enyl diphosphate reductase